MGGNVTERAVWHTCTREDPWTPDKGPWNLSRHPHARWVGEQDEHTGDSFDIYECPYCKQMFEVEVAR